MSQLKPINVCRGCTKYNKTLLLYRRIPNDYNNVMTYEREHGEQVQPFSIIQQYQKHPKTEKYMPVLSNNRNVSMSDEYREIIREADDLIRLTNGKYNFYQCGSYHRMMYRRFCLLNPHVPAQRVTREEAQFIEGCYNGGILYGQDGYEGDGYCYDYNSFYPSVMIHNDFKFPINEGTISTITQADLDSKKFVSFGIYRVIIDKKVPVNGFNYIYASKTNYFTHIDINHARKRGHKITVIEDGSPNAIIYKYTDLVSGKQMCEQYINELYPLKKENPSIKYLLNHLWGLLCQSNKKSSFDVKETLNYKKIDGRLLGDIENQKELHKYFVLDDPYITPFARLKPFMTALSRRIMADQLLKFEPEHIVRVYVDSYILTTRDMFHIESKKCGHIKCEYSGKLKVINKIQVLKLSL